MADTRTRPTAGEEPAFFSRQITEARRFYLQLREGRSGSERFSVINGGHEHCAQDFHIQRDDFPYYAIEFVAQGEGTVILNGKSHPLVTGAVFAYGPRVSHEIRSNPLKPLSKYFVNFDGNRTLEHFVKPAPQPGDIAQSSAPEQISEIFEQLIEAGKRESPFRERICRTIGEHLLLRIAESAVPLGTMGTVAFETFTRCRQWIDQNYRQAESLEQIASKCRVDEAYICRLFKRYAHQSPWQYILRLKMRDAAHRLQSRDVRVSDVAYEFGFGDPFQFSRTFHRVLGISPRAFIRLQRRGKPV